MNTAILRLWALIVRQHRAHPALFWVRLVVLFGVVLFFALQRNFWTPDTLFMVLLGVFVIFGQARAFLYRFFPFVGLLLVYDSFRSIADDLNKFVHFTEMIDADRLLFFGTLPTAWLQYYWWNGQLQWYDFYFYFLYTIHFVAPLLLAIVIWKKRDQLYWPYVTAFIALSFAAFVTYIIFPAAPPWMAAEQGYIEPIERISSHIWYAMGVTNFSEVYANLSPNPVAAVPSLHAAYPLLFWFFTLAVFGWRRVWWLSFYPISVWVGIVYLGEHYVVDALLGGLYAWLAFYLSLKYFALPSKQRHINKLLQLFSR